MRSTLAIAALALGHAGCVDLDIYLCRSAQDCRRGDERGSCAPPGYCAYADDGCASGLRFSDLAGEGLARACVEPDGTTDPSSSDDGVPSGCGNGTVDADEACDDRNAVDGDGCNTDCRLSGEVLWSVTIAGAAGMRDHADELTVLATGDPVVVGGLATADATAAWVARLSGDDGTVRWTWSPVAAWTDSFAHGIAVDSDNQVGVVGRRQTADEGQRAFAIALSPEGVPSWSVEPPGELAVAIVGNVEGFVVAGQTFDGATYAGVITALGPNGEQRWSVASGLAGNNAYTDVNGHGFDDVVLVAEVESDVALQRCDGTTVTTLAMFADEIGGRDAAQGLAVHPSGDWLLAGFQSTIYAHDPWLARVRADGTEVWSDLPHITAAAVDDEFEDVVADPAGAVFTVGFVTNDGKGAVVRKYDADGGLIWSRTYDVGLGDDAGRSIGLAPDGGVFVAGEAPGADGSGDVWVARLGK